MGVVEVGLPRGVAWVWHKACLGLARAWPWVSIGAGWLEEWTCMKPIWE